MISQPPLPVDLRGLFPAGQADHRSLSAVLPSGHPIASDESDGGVHALWLSDEPAAAGLWAQLRAEHAHSGLWPLLLVSEVSEVSDDDEFRPWASGEVFPQRMTSPDTHDAGELLAQWWSDYTAADEDDDMLSREERLGVTAPFGQAWPGFAPSSPATRNPDEWATEYAHAFAVRRPLSRLGLVAAPSGADALAIAGWAGPANYDNDTAKYSAVVRDWERRFGVRVVALGFDTLHLSVAAPPQQHRRRLLVAAEHLAFCPDNIWQGAGTLTDYAAQVTGTHAWEFWWD